MSLDKDFFNYGSPPPHPGEVLREDVLPEMGLTCGHVARHLGISVRLLAEILHERRPVTLDVARRLGAAFGSGAHYWLGLQMQHDLWLARHGDPIEIRPLVRERANRQLTAGPLAN